MVRGTALAYRGYNVAAPTPHANDPHKYGAWNGHVPGNHCLGAIRVRLDTARALTVAWKV